MFIRYTTSKKVTETFPLKTKKKQKTPVTFLKFQNVKCCLCTFLNTQKEGFNDLQVYSLFLLYIYIQ